MITVYGASDDLIEVEGDVEEEFDYSAAGNSDDSGYLLAFSDGTVLRIWLDSAWRIKPVTTGAGKLVIVPCPEDDEDNYSDRATIDAEITWVVQGVAIAKR
ncbi:MAG TPA: hypothetical protein VFR23_04180 [Jiangellaceae bacterium]|nr:hypothetical protein [Jiangellaceae bacterium]